MNLSFTLFSAQEHAERLLGGEGRAAAAAGRDFGEAALVAMEPGTGAVRCLVGSRDYSISPYNRAVLAKRSPGSTFKPFVYVAALACGVATPRTLLRDEELVFRAIPGAGSGPDAWRLVSRAEVASERAAGGAAAAEAAAVAVVAAGRGAVMLLPGENKGGRQSGGSAVIGGVGELPAARPGAGPPRPAAARRAPEYRPENSTGAYRGWASVHDALVHSLNVPTVHLTVCTSSKLAQNSK